MITKLWLMVPFLLWTGGFPAFAQQKNGRMNAEAGNIRPGAVVAGKVTDVKGNPVAYASVLLLKASDSSLAEGMITAVGGNYKFKQVPPGPYLIKTMFAGYLPQYTPVFQLTAGEKFTPAAVALSPSSMSLQGVTVHAKKPLYEQKIDRMIINVKSSPMAASETALDVLEKSPGVRVDRQDQSISINGKNGVVVMINGRKQYMPMSAFYQMLSSMRASAVDRIELITTPPAKYDAEGNAGYINIVLTSNPDMGFKGSWDLTLGYPYGQMPGADFNFSYRHQRLSLFGSVGFNRKKVRQRFANYRRVGAAPNFILTNTVDDRNAVTPYTSVRLGGDYALDSSTSVGAIVTGFNRHWQMTSANNTSIGSPDIVDTLIKAKNSEINHLQNLMGNLHIKHDFDKQNNLTVDLNYIYFRDNNPNHYAYSYYDGEKNFLYNSKAMSGKLTPIHFWVFSTDYTHKTGSKMELETGAKYSITRFVNDITVLNDQKIQPDMSARYFLKENTGALYASLSLNLDHKTALKGGLRYEYTTSNLGTHDVSDIVNRKYGELFPTFYFSREIDKGQSLNVSYSRRINRPSLRDLAPFTIFMDPSTLVTGNPALQPSITNTVELSYMLKNLVFKSSYSYETHTISEYNQVDAVANKELKTKTNLDHTQYVSVSASLPLTITPWWSMHNTASGYFRQIEAGYEGILIAKKGFDYNLNSVQDFTFHHGFSLELKAFYYSPEVGGFGKISSYGMLGLGGSKKFRDQGTLSFSILDLLGRASFSLSDKMPEQHFFLKARDVFWTRNLSVTYSRNFGNKSLKVKRKWSTGSEEELNRVNN